MLPTERTEDNESSLFHFQAHANDSRISLSVFSNFSDTSGERAACVITDLNEDFYINVINSKNYICIGYHL